MAVGHCLSCNRTLFPQSRYLRCSGPCLNLFCLSCTGTPSSKSKDWKTSFSNWLCTTCSPNPSGSESPIVLPSRCPSPLTGNSPVTCCTIDCTHCHRIASLELMLTTALDRISTLESTVSVLSLGNIPPPDVSAVSPSDYSSALKKNLDPLNPAILVNKLRSEERKQSSLACNIVISGLDLPSSDINLVPSLSPLWSSLRINQADILSAATIGSSPKVKVSFINCETATRALTNSPSLKNHDLYHNVFLNRDLTRAEQELGYSLRCQLREKRINFPNKSFFIRNGSIRERLPTSPSAQLHVPDTANCSIPLHSVSDKSLEVLPAVSSSACSATTSAACSAGSTSAASCTPPCTTVSNTVCHTVPSLPASFVTPIVHNSSIVPTKLSSQNLETSR